MCVRVCVGWKGCSDDVIGWCQEDECVSRRMRQTSQDAATDLTQHVARSVSVFPLCKSVS